MVEIDNSLINVDLEKCTLCKACINDCVTGIFYVESDKLKILDDFEKLCLFCGHCVAICPVNAIKLKVNDESFTKDIYKIKPVFRLHPPRKGHRGSIKKHYNAGGILGYCEDYINELVHKMM